MNTVNWISQSIPICPQLNKTTKVCFHFTSLGWVRENSSKISCFSSIFTIISQRESLNVFILASIGHTLVNKADTFPSFYEAYSLREGRRISKNVNKLKTTSWWDWRKETVWRQKHILFLSNLFLYQTPEQQLQEDLIISAWGSWGSWLMKDGIWLWRQTEMQRKREMGQQKQHRLEPKWTQSMDWRFLTKGGTNKATESSRSAEPEKTLG